MTLLCVSLTASTPEQMRADMHRAFAAGAEMVELRLDMLTNPDADAIIRHLLGDKPGPVIATCRYAAEGGHFDGDETRRISLLEQVGLDDVDYIDCEYAAWSASGNIRQKIGLVADVNADSSRHRKRLILSAHDFEKTPDDLDGLFARLADAPGHVVKLATKANVITDNLRMWDAVRKVAERKPAIGLCMGEAGVISRILAGKAGGWLTFVALEAGAESAPGQVTLDEMKQLYRWDAIRETTAVYGVIGSPIAHSMSPAIHNAAFAHAGLDAVYLPLLIRGDYDEFAGFLDGCRRREWIGLAGCSVTIPHKLNALRYVGENIEPLAQTIGAVNTLIFENDAVRGINTDYVAALDAITDALDCERNDLKNTHAAVLGSGGAARAIVAALAHYGCRVTLYNRTWGKAATLADEFHCHVEAWENRDRIEADLLINTTSLGMYPHMANSPVSSNTLRKTMMVFDMVYNPIETKLLADARSVGCRTVDGVTMFIKQAVAQFEAWTGQSAPVDCMRRIVLDKLTTASS